MLRKNMSKEPKTKEFQDDGIRTEMRQIERAMRRIPDPSVRYAVAMMVDIIGSAYAKGEKLAS